MRRLLLALALILPAAARAAGPDNSAWPMMNNNPQHNSTTTVAGVTTPKFSWRYGGTATNPRQFMGVVLGSNGTVYVGGRADFFALNPDGSVKFTANEALSGAASWGTPAVGDNGWVYVSSETGVYAYSTAGSGNVTFVSSAAVGNALNDPGGGGAVKISSYGYVFVSHGDETLIPSLGSSQHNLYSFTSTLASQTAVTEGTSSGWGRGALFLAQTSKRVCSANGNGTFNLECFDRWASPQLDITVAQSIVGANRQGYSFRGDDSFTAIESNYSSECPAHPSGGNKHLVAWTHAGVLVWRKCDLDLGTSPRLNARTIVSDSSLNSYVAISSAQTLSGPRVIKVDNTGATVWSHTPGSAGSPATTDSLGPLTLAAGATVYFTYCAGTTPACTGVGTCTRMAALDAATGDLQWDILVSTRSCFSGQPVPAPGNRLYLHNGTEILAFENSEAAAMSVSSSAAAADGLTTVWSTTATVTVTKAGALPVSSGVVVEVTHFNHYPSSVWSSVISPNTTGFLLTDTAGQAKFPVQLNIGGLITASEYKDVLATVTFRSPGAAPQTVTIRESRPATVQVSTTTPILTGTSQFYYTSTMTFTVRDSLGNPVSNVPCTSRAAIGAGPTMFPGSKNPNWNPMAGFWATDGAGQASFAFMDNLNGTASTNANYSVYAVTHTVACLGMPSQQMVMKEHRVASVTVDTGTATMEGTIRVSNIAVTLRDSLSQPVPGVPVALKNQAAPLGMSVTITPFAANFTTATDNTGTALFRVEENLLGVQPSAFASMVSTYTLHILSNPSVPLYLKEERVASVAVSTSLPALEPGFPDKRVLVATVTVRDSLSNPLPGIPVAFESLVYGNLTTFTPTAGTYTGLAVTNALGVATVTVRQDLLSGNVPFDEFGIFYASAIAAAPYFPAAVFNPKEVRAASYTVAVSSTRITPDLRYATFTVTVRDLSNNPVPYVPVAISSYSRHQAGGATLPYIAVDPMLGTKAGVFTDAAGVARFTMRIAGGGAPNDYKSSFDTYDDSYSSAAVIPLGLSLSTIAFFVESNRLDHYEMVIPTYTSVGVAFASTITATNVYAHKLSSYTETGINLTPLFAGSAVQGTGTLGTAITGAFAGGTFVIPDQTYNKVELIEVKAQRSSDGKNGRSNSIDVLGPAAFRVHVPTSATAGNPFSMTVEAVSALGVRVVGYAATLSLSALQAGNTSQAGAGILGTTNINLPGNGIVTITNQTYTKSESIKIRATDSGSSIVGISTDTLTMRAGTPTSMTLTANPQSTIATVPSVLSSVVQDVYGNKVVGATVTYSVLNGSGVVSLSLSGGSVVSAVTSTNAVTDANGTAGAFFSSTNTLSSQANLMRVTLGALTTDTTIYNAVLITPAGGAIVNLADPRIRVDCPANAWSFAIRMSAQSRNELSAADLALTTAAFAAQSDVFVSTVVAKLTAVRDSNPTVSAGNSPTKVNLSLPFEVTGSSQVTVGSYRGQSILVPLSVLRIFKLNSATSLFEMVLDGTNLADLSSRTVTAQLSDPNGIYALGAPPFTALASGSSGTVTAVLAAGATATVDVPFGAFSAATNLQVGVPSAASVPALPTGRSMTGTGLTISIQTTNGLQPIRPVSVTIGYRAQDVVGMNPDHLRLARYDDSTGWVVLDSSVDTITRKVTGDTDHFSLFQIVAVAPQGDLSRGIVFPNPFRPNAGHTMLKFGQLPALAKVRIFTVSGRLLKQLETDATGQVLSWDAKDKDGNVLPSGVYLALIESGNDRKTLKFAIQR